MTPSDFLGKIICGDNVAVLSEFPDKCIDLVVTSPPYDNLRVYGGHSWNFEALAAQLTRVLKPGGVIVWVVADATIDGSETLTSMRHAIHFKDVCGLNVHDTMICNKCSFAFPEATRYQPFFEFMFILSNGKPCTTNLIKDKPNKWAGAKVHGTGRYADGSTRPHNAVSRGLDRRYEEYGQRGNIWDCPNPGRAGSVHPATFPESLAKDHIISWSNPGDIVLDPFSGSGTTCKAAKELGRKWCGVEINAEYCAIAAERMRQEVFDLSPPSEETKQETPEKELF